MTPPTVEHREIEQKLETQWIKGFEAGYLKCAALKTQQPSRSPQTVERINEQIDGFMMRHIPSAFHEEFDELRAELVEAVRLAEEQKGV